MKRGGVMEEFSILSSGIVFHDPKITNGSKIVIGKEKTITFFVDQHFNWLQKKMIKLFFGLKFLDYSE